MGIEQGCALAPVGAHVDIDAAVVARLRVDFESAEILERESPVRVAGQDPTVSDGFGVADGGGGGVGIGGAGDDGFGGDRRGIDDRR